MDIRERLSVSQGQMLENDRGSRPKNAKPPIFDAAVAAAVGPNTRQWGEFTSHQCFQFHH